MTNKKAAEIYMKCCPNDVIDKEDPRYLSICREIKAIAKAKTPQAAAKIIEWWGWDYPQQMYEFIRKVKRLARVVAHGK